MFCLGFSWSIICNGKRTLQLMCLPVAHDLDRHCITHSSSREHPGPDSPTIRQPQQA
ncbi:uncharacterized protein B0I36DRAFT_329076 [Microdochium trichocladiopsis]|uniref:Uncharacterized protein n=1 Tax=Microdochium trichocladiopsis TaxID=1682393 RepID=A0A9P8XZ00_9PEZI|nr:uncharacterized protein B0I36DRAFT_329076 [Microdochium trichocladiopsis]KAH7025759.1 hypothetical protein B0I36DRAFT_329076 [Microdochium trichocladiopsis]